MQLICQRVKIYTDQRSSSGDLFGGGILRFIIVHRNRNRKVADGTRFKDIANVREQKIENNSRNANTFINMNRKHLK